MGIYTPKISPTRLLSGKNDVKTAIEHEYGVLYLPKNLYPPPKKKNSGYDPAPLVTFSLFKIVFQ